MNTNLKLLLIADICESLLSAVMGGIVSTASAILFGGMNPANIALLNIITRSFGIFSAPFMMISKKVSYTLSRIIDTVGILWLIIPFGVSNEVFAIVAVILLCAKGYVYLSFDTSVGIRINKGIEETKLKKIRGTTSSAVALIGIVCVAISAFVVNEYGWRIAYTIAGAIEALVILANTFAKKAMDNLDSVTDIVELDYSI